MTAPQDTPLPEGWTSMPLGEILTIAEIRAVRVLLDQKDDAQQHSALRRYLQARRGKLLKKGVHPDYLYYFLQHMRAEGRL